MLIFNSNSCCFVLICVVFNCLVFCEDNIVEEQEVSSSELKVYIHPINGQTNWFKPKPIKPTAATTHFEPGVPPGWPKPPKTTRKPPRPTRRPLSTTKNPIFSENFETRPPLINTNKNRTQDYEPLSPVIDNNIFAHHTHQLTSATSSFSNNLGNRNGTIQMEPLVLNPNYTNPVRASFFDWLLGLIGVRPPDGQKPESTTSSTSHKKCPSCSCGKTYNMIRIVGGIQTRINQYPWMVALKYNNRFYCGATLINDRYIITAAHCINGFSKERLTALFLDHDRNNQFETKSFSRGIKKVLRHGGYATGGNYNNDIALLQLDKDVSMTGLLRPVCLPTLGKSYTGFVGVVTGWGATQEHGQVSNILREVEVPIMSNSECRKTGYSSRITDNMLCAGYPKGMKDSCQGDSGGPLHVVNNSQNAIVGIVSWGEGCAEPNFPGVYTRVNRYITWIKSNTKDACYCS